VPGIAVSAKAQGGEGPSATLVAEANAILDKIRAVGASSWPHWRKDEIMKAVEALVEAQRVVAFNGVVPDDHAFRERFSAALKLLLNC
jgi:hypothetical protein